MQLPRLGDLLIILGALHPVLCSKMRHLILLKQVLIDLLPNKLLILALHVLHNAFSFRHLLVPQVVPIIILLLRYVVHAHFIDLVLLREGALARREVTLDGRIKLAPSENNTHLWVQVPQILLLPEQPALKLLVNIPGKHLVLDLDFAGVGLALVARAHFFEGTTGQDLLHFFSSLMPLTQLLSRSVRVRLISFHNLNSKKFNKFKNVKSSS